MSCAASTQVTLLRSHALIQRRVLLFLAKLLLLVMLLLIAVYVVSVLVPFGRHVVQVERNRRGVRDRDAAVTRLTATRQLGRRFASERLVLLCRVNHCYVSRRVLRTCGKQLVGNVTIAFDGRLLLCVCPLALGRRSIVAHVGI